MSGALVASPHFRRMAGMLWRCANGADLRLSFAHEHVYWDGLNGGRPVETDPATLGCLLHLVREAWGLRGLHVRLEMAAHGDSWWVFEDDDTVLWLDATGGPICCATEAEALERALLAAPPKETS